jgi:hypothetical protein
VTPGETRAIELRPYHALALLPMVGLLGGVWFANRTEPYVLGLPFLLFWIVLWVVGASMIMWIIWTLDRARGVRAALVEPTDRSEHRR